MPYLWRQFTEPEFQLRLSVSLGMVVFQCLVAIWAATSKQHWFWRVLAVWAAIMLMVPIRAWDPAWLFGLSSPLIVGFLTISRWWKLTEPPEDRSARDDSNTKKRWRFSLLDLLLMMVIAGLWIHGTQLVVRNYQPRNWVGWLAASVSLAALATVAYACARSPRRWMDVALLCVALAEFEGAFALGYPFVGMIAAGAALAAYGCAFDRRHWVVMLLLACVVPGAAAAVCASGPWMRHLDPLNIAARWGTFWEKGMVMTVLAAEVVAMLVIVLGLMRAARLQQLWIPWRILIGGILTMVACLAAIGVGRTYVRLLNRTLPITPVARLEVPNNQYDQIMELGRSIVGVNGGARTVADLRAMRPNSKRPQALEERYQKLFLLLDRHNAVPYDPHRDADIEYQNGTTGKWSAIHDLLSSLEAEAAWALENKRPSETVDFALAMVRLGDMLARGGVWVDHSAAILIRRRGYAQLIKLRADFPADRLEQAIQILRRSVAEREDQAVLHARQADFEEKAYGWGMRLESLLTGNPEVAGEAARIWQLWGQVDMTTNILLQADLAIRRFQRDEGRLPLALEELVPKYLPHLPRDPNSEPLRYRIDGNQFALYSIGWDRHDDGGKFGLLGEYLSSNPAGQRQPPSSRRATFDFDLETWTRE